MTPYFEVALWARCSCDVRIGNLWGWKAHFNCCHFATDCLHAVRSWFSIIIIFNCHHFATDCLHTLKCSFLLSSFSIVITLQLTILRQWKHSLSIVITLQLTIAMQLKCSFSIIIIFNCCHFATDHPHTVKTLIVSLFFQMTKFKSYLISYHPMQKSLKLKKWSGHGEMIDSLESFYTWKTFTWEGNYLVIRLLQGQMS